MKTILITDSETSAGSVAEALRRSGYRCISTAGASAALDLIRNGETIDLMITELSLSDMEGIEFIAAVRGLAPELPVIVVSARGTIESYLKALALGIADFLNKPVPLRELLRIVQTTVGPPRTGEPPGRTTERVTPPFIAARGTARAVQRGGGQ